MRIRLLLLLVASAVTLSYEAVAQAPAQQTIVRQDGGQSGRMESVFFPPKAGAPFILTLATEWSRPLGNGGTFTVVNERHVMRDQAGRIYQERWLLVPKGGKIQSRMNVFQITDPHRHTWYNCEVEYKVCDLYRYSLTTQAEYPPAIRPSGPLPNGNGFHQHEDLGLNSSNGVETHGYRETTTIEAGVMGNDKPMVTSREFWYSTQLGFNLESTVETPQTGKQVFTVKELSTSAPDPSFFTIPEGYKVVDRTRE